MSSELEKRIMRRVYAIWLFRKAFGLRAMEIYSLLIIAIWMLSYVSPENIAANFFQIVSSSGSFSKIMAYLASAVSSTETAVKLLGVAMASILALLAGSFFVKEEKSFISRV